MTRCLSYSALGLLRLLQTGHDVRTAQFSLDVLLVDGERKAWWELEAR